ncbi:disease resistance protein RGA2-like [Chenopodium quinoa]|uniref:disease resistance protein RGA2-like n=1 Tax=Chenopodium quinoa TaxID=63459 RepID=UPI000B789DF5|nr:disease resistance protein RGA2-like [Chenopodium quinoa]
MDVAGGLSLVQTILQLLDSAVWKETRSVLGVKSQLHKLKKTMSTIDSILREAEEQERLHHSHSSYPERDRLERLKEALYQADDLFDEVTTLAHRKQLMPGNNLSKEVSLFFSRFNQLRSAFIWSREIKSIRERLDDVVKDHQLAVGFRHPVVLKDSTRETHSYVNLENLENDVIIGRDDDKRFLIDMLLDTTVEGNVSVVSIVGIGGLGKTTLAQLVYSDDKIKKEFPLKMWVCVSDNFNVKALAGQILAAATNQANQSDGLSMDQLQIKLREGIDRNKYLLVLDDVWNENSEEWRTMKNLLVGGGKGSRILVTTRCKKVAVVVGSCWTHELKGLSDEHSWNLFQRMTLESGQHQIEANLVDIGKEIVRKCANVPLAIRVVGSLLRGQEESKWENLKNTDLANIVQDESNGIIPVLKISYNYLPFHLKSCFSYCAVFPKDYEIIKEDLICLWMAQGFIMPSDAESFEDVGEEYFKQLLQRCFFQDVERAEGTKEIISCKMHDLIHDLAKEVAGTDILSCTYSTRCFNEKTRHVFIDRSTPKDVVGKLSNMQRMRTFLGTEVRYFSLKPFVGGVSNLKYLRVLRLNDCDGLKKLPSGIGELVHLRYLDLSYNGDLCVLPSSITKLYSLQTLKLCGCMDLKRLPRELRKLVNLRHLDISGCWSLTCMPPGMNSMASLRNLTGFVVSGSATSDAVLGCVSGQLEDLDDFTNYTHTMEIVVKRDVRYDAVGGGMLFKSPKLWEVMYNWVTEENTNAEVLLQGLQPHSNLRQLRLWCYPGAGLPTWMMTLSCCLPNLVQIEIRDCKRLEHLPLMSKLRHLKVLKLKGLSEVEYMESSSINSGDDDELVFFPSLETLELWGMPKLKGWWKSSSESEESETPQAPKLSRLDISGCPELTTFPLCPELQELELKGFNEALGPIMRESAHGLSVSNNNHKEDQGRQGRLRKVTTDNVGYLTSLPIHYLSNLCITFEQKELKTGEVGEVFRSGRLSSLRSLQISFCHNLKSISGRGVWDQFTALETLTLYYLPGLELEDEDDVSNNKSTEEGSDAEMPWRYLAPTLRSLELSGLDAMVKLPKGIGCLSSLHSLNIMYCPKLKTMPKEMRHLTSLTELHIWECSPELMKECKNKNGANWSNIQHIPNIKLDFF